MHARNDAVSGGTHAEPTFVLTDIVGSTTLWQRNSDAMAESVRAHEAILRSAFDVHDGREFGTAGDSFAVAFDDPALAAAAAVTAQESLARHDWGAARIEVRIGLHSGPAEFRAGRYFGSTVHRAARIMGEGSGGQILVSGHTAALIGTQLPHGCELVDLGDHRLRSFDEAEQIHGLVRSGTDAKSITLGTTDSGAPSTSSELIGRSEELDAITTRLEPGSLLTITGLGGIGKTRLAIEAANRVMPQFSDGVAWTDLAAVQDASSAVAVVLAELGLTPQPGIPADVAIADGLRRQNKLVIVDNCEHVRHEIAQLLQVVQQKAPGVALMCTSRVPIGVYGEIVWHLDALDPATDAVELLIDRIKTHDASAGDTAPSRAALEEICVRLDGMPLAIEMVAARLRSMPPQKILDRLDQRLRLLRSRDPGVDGRQQSIQATLDWSYEQLDSDEQHLLERLSVFSGWFDLEAIVCVCGDEEFDEFDIIDLLATLLDMSLVVREPGIDASRYRLPETVNVYAATLLPADDRAMANSQLVTHVADDLRLVGIDYLDSDFSTYAAASAKIESRWDVIRDGFAAAVEATRADDCDQILAAIWDFIFQRSRIEVEQWAKQSMAMTNPPVLALVMAATTSGAAETSLGLTEKALSMVDSNEPSHIAALCYGVRHWQLVFGDPVVAIENDEQGLHHATAMGLPEWAWQHANLAALLVEREPERARLHADEARNYFETSGNPLRTTCVPSMAMYEAKSGNPQLGHELCDRAVRLATESELTWTAMTSLSQRAAIATQFELPSARDDLIEALEVCRSARAWYAVWLAAGAAVRWLVDRGDVAVAASLMQYLDSRGIWYPPLDSDMRTLLASERSSQSDIRPSRDVLIDQTAAALKLHS